MSTTGFIPAAGICCRKRTGTARGGLELRVDEAGAVTYGRYRRVHRRVYRRAYRSAYYSGAPSYYYGAPSYYYGARSYYGAPSYYGGPGFYFGFGRRGW